MAVDEHVQRLLEHSVTWGQWRRDFPNVRPDLFRADLAGAKLSDADLSGANLSGAKLRDAKLSGADLSDANLVSANLAGANLSGAKLRDANLRGAILSGADLSDANLVSANLAGANLSGAKLRDANLRGAILSDADLSGANLSGADLSGANLGGADLHNANLRRATLNGAYLGNANLTGANLVNAKLTDANLGGANLGGADLRGADLSRTILSGTLLLETVFGDTDLTGVDGLETCIYLGPSTVDFRTIKESWPLPLVFLRGVGLPDNLIEYLPSLVDQAIQYYSCFISYSAKDDEFAERLHADLQNNGVRCWFAPHDLPIGAKILDEIDVAIRQRDKVLLVLSAQSIGSDWVEDEVKTAYEEERKRGRTVLFPVRLDDAVMEAKEAWASKLRADRNIGDFRQWKSHDDYQKTLERVLRDLKADRKATSP